MLSNDLKFIYFEVLQKKRVWRYLKKKILYTHYCRRSVFWYELRNTSVKRWTKLVISKRGESVYSSTLLHHIPVLWLECKFFCSVIRKCIAKWSFLIPHLQNRPSGLWIFIYFCFYFIRHGNTPFVGKRSSYFTWRYQQKEKKKKINEI